MASGGLGRLSPQSPPIRMPGLGIYTSQRHGSKDGAALPTRMPGLGVYTNQCHGSLGPTNGAALPTGMPGQVIQTGQCYGSYGAQHRTRYTPEIVDAAVAIIQQHQADILTV